MKLPLAIVTVIGYKFGGKVSEYLSESMKIAR